ncbi:hypothetical protein QC761_603438 [Podospora bellae-mahoneyi]|uniref:Uncharacterized protein n=1 Tax=Podospora bellae-mahoneyi TaxID=2093777 RepID=A0ABR0FB84_9PEZI|nr:hypothetical protein QC761_603438 [Podospora bellae-mahoneyi]
MPPSDCIHFAARKAWMIHATAKEQRHHRWHSLTLLGCIGGHVLRTRNGNTHPYTPLNSGRYGESNCIDHGKKKSKDTNTERQARHLDRSRKQEPERTTGLRSMQFC